MKITELNSAPENPNPHKVEVRKLYDKKHAQAMHITLRPGESLLKHITPVDVFFYVLRGTPTIEIGEEIAEAGKDSLVESPAGIPHRIMNRTDKDVRVLVVKTPRPTKSTRLL